MLACLVSSGPKDISIISSESSFVVDEALIASIAERPFRLPGNREHLFTVSFSPISPGLAALLDIDQLTVPSRATISPCL